MSKTKPQVDATCDRSTVSSASNIPPFVFSFCLKGKTNIHQPVGLGNFDVSDFSNPTKSLFGRCIFVFDTDDCSFIFRLLLFI